MRKFTAIIESSTPPQDINSIWVYKGTMKYFSNGKWINMQLTTSTEDPTGYSYEHPQQENNISE